MASSASASRRRAASLRHANDVMASPASLMGSASALHAAAERAESAAPSSPSHAPSVAAQYDGTCCGLNAAALEQGAGRASAANADVVYASFTSQLGHTVPYCVCVDHANRRVVVAIRGTLTVSDAVVDLTMVPEPLKPYAERWGFLDEIDPASAHAHSGLLRIAAWMRADLERTDVLHRLFRVGRGGGGAGEDGDAEADAAVAAVAAEESAAMGASVSATAAANRDRRGGEDLLRDEAEDDLRSRAFSVDIDLLPDCRGYELDLTGHSLGGGVAVVLSLFLRPAFPFVRCMAFSPPGCVFDFKLAEKSSEWVSTLFVGKDYAARMSWHSLFKLRGQILDTLRRARTNKIVAMASALTGAPASSMLFKPNEVPDTPHTRAFERKLDELVTSRRSTILDDVRLYMPGKILHLVKHQTVGSRSWWLGGCMPNLTPHYVPVWVDDRSALDEILLSTRMAVDHFPVVVDETLRDVFREYCPTPLARSSQGPLPLSRGTSGAGLRGHLSASAPMVGESLPAIFSSASPSVHAAMRRHSSPRQMGGSQLAARIYYAEQQQEE